ncbi:hypothetical protein CPHO_08310 [Corynebacterium phocae]|uniref:Uncharacterized protein n=1 Tax=Corynebacterium phocae TaxID=161895 RepID=A0A1L7D6T0_9CORY|nr:hypothetical protein CPHO_08310 [Corynebacterium phocae]
MTWPVFLEQWQLIELDFQQHYHIDLAAPGLLESRRWGWFETRVIGLLGAETRLATHLQNRSKELREDT